MMNDSFFPIVSSSPGYKNQLANIEPYVDSAVEFATQKTKHEILIEQNKSKNQPPPPNSTKDIGNTGRSPRRVKTK